MNPIKWLSKIPCKTLNDNPRVQAEIRIWILENRRIWVNNIRGPRFFMGYANGAVSSVRFGTLSRAKAERASKIIQEINREISRLQSFLKSF